MGTLCTFWDRNGAQTLPFGGGGGAHTYMAYIWEYRRVEYKENSFLMVIFWFALMFFDYILIISEFKTKY